MLACFTTSLVPSSQAVAITARDSVWLNAGMLSLAMLMVYVLTVSILETTVPAISGKVWTAMVMIPLIVLQAVVVVPACRDSNWWKKRMNRRFMQQRRKDSLTWARTTLSFLS